MTDTYIAKKVGSVIKYTISKDPDAVLDYVFDWTEWLDDIDDTISGIEIIPETGITCDSSSFTEKTAIAWISGGIAGTTYQITCRITTAAGRIDDRSIYISVIER